MEPEMFVPTRIELLITWHNIVITWSVARMKTTVKKVHCGSSICIFYKICKLVLNRDDPNQIASSTYIGFYLLRAKFPSQFKRNYLKCSDSHAPANGTEPDQSISIGNI